MIVALLFGPLWMNKMFTVSSQFAFALGLGQKLWPGKQIRSDGLEPRPVLICSQMEKERRRIRWILLFPMSSIWFSSCSQCVQTKFLRGCQFVLKVFICSSSCSQYLTLRSALSLNNPQNSETFFCENMKVDYVECDHRLQMGCWLGKYTSIKGSQKMKIKHAIYLWRKVVCFILFFYSGSTKPGCFRSFSWCFSKALNEKGCMGLVPLCLDWRCKSSWILTEN
jgi:hypothetical protein